MSAANRFWTWFNGDLAPWDVTGATPPAYVDLNYFGDVVSRLDHLLPDAGLQVIATRDLVGPLPMTGRDVVVLCLEDEFAVTPRYAHQVRLVAKTMGGRRRRPYLAVRPGVTPLTFPLVVGQELMVQARRTPWMVRAARVTAMTGRRPPVLDIPLGIRAYEPIRSVPPAKRRYDVAFAGSLVNEAREHDRPWASQKLRARRTFIAEVERLRDTRRDLSVWLRVVATHWDGASATESYAHALADSRIVLCPRGSSVDTHRYFEALRAGCIPLYEMLPRRDYYDGAPGVRVRDWRELPRIVDRLLADPEDLRGRHRASLEWYDRWVSPQAVAARIATAIAQPG